MTEQLVYAEAYLGPNMPETLADATLMIPAQDTHRDYHYGVVRQDATSGECTLVDIYRSEAAAISRVDSITTHKGWGILTNIRTQPIASEDQEEPCS